MTKTLESVKVYWDSSCPDNEGWAYSLVGENGVEISGAVEGMGDDDLCGAIDEACHQLDLPLTHDNFGLEPTVHGGYGYWSAE